VSRVPSAARKPSDDSDEAQNGKKKKSDISASAKLHYLENLVDKAQIPHQGRLPKDEEEKRRVLRSLAILRAGHTIQECADQFGVSDTTIENWLKDPLYVTEQQTTQADVRSAGFIGVATLVPEAIGMVAEIMRTANSAFVQLQAAQYLLKLAGMETPQVAAQVDEKRGIANFLEQVRIRAETIQVNVQINQVGSEPAQVVNAAPGVEIAGYAPGDILSPSDFLQLQQQQAQMFSEYDMPMEAGGKLAPLPGEEENGPYKRKSKPKFLARTEDRA